jgi:8-oxo-dGTP pyrophosphatase MutT (NUDIX family)
MNIDKADYPHLFQEKIWTWGPIKTEFELHVMPPERLISNVNLIPFVGNDCVIIRTTKGWGITGGTLEPGEHYMEAIQRELMEEAGARLINFELIGAWHCHSLADRPYRPHLPWPEFYRIVGYGEVDLIKDPENPEEGEQIIEVGIFSPEEAYRLLAQRPDDGVELAEIYRLAVLLKEKDEKEKS